MSKGICIGCRSVLIIKSLHTIVFFVSSFLCQMYFDPIHLDHVKFRAQDTEKATNTIKWLPPRCVAAKVKAFNTLQRFPRKMGPASWQSNPCRQHRLFAIERKQQSLRINFLSNICTFWRTSNASQYIFNCIVG